MWHVALTKQTLAAIITHVLVIISRMRRRKRRIMEKKKKKKLLLRSCRTWALCKNSFDAEHGWLLRPESTSRIQTETSLIH